MTDRGKLTGSTHQGLLREEVTRLGAQLTTDHILVKTVVTIDTHMTESCQRTLLYAHLDIDGVAHDIHLGRIDAGEHITVVPIQVTHSVIVATQTLFQQCLVIYVTTLHGEQLVQSVGSIYGITHPLDVADVVFLTLIHLDIDIDMLVVVVPHTILKDGSITVTVLVILGNQLLFILLPTLGRVFLLLQEG